jgi:hypothetical protein
MKILFLLSVLIAAIASLTAQTATQPALGNGTNTDPYQIATLENLFWIAADDSIVPSPAQAIRGQAITSKRQISMRHQLLIGLKVWAGVP